MSKSKNKCIAAVSGGPDSMAMLHKFKRNIIAVCHVNYHKRVDSDYDTKIVKSYCAKHNIRLFVHNVNPKIYDAAQEHNFQTLARKIRYEFFVKCAKKVKCNNIIIAHNLNDFVETAIMQERRHSLNFFYGIKQHSTYKNLNIDRPLIKQFKSDLEKYCVHKKIDFAIDSSNSSDIYERNRIRKELNKLSKKQLLDLYKKFYLRNKRHEKIEKIINKHLKVWKQKNYSVEYIKGLEPNLINSVIYVYLKNNKIININYNKIKLVRDYIVSKKSNNNLRLETNVSLSKKNGRVKLCQKK